MSEEKPLTSGKITASLFWMLRGSSDLMIPRYTPPKWWECDLWRLTKSGNVDEYEIKLSISDFRADFKKDDNPYYLAPGTSPRRKHQLLADTEEGPNRFWFVCASGILQAVENELPSYAGLVAVSQCGAQMVRRAPTRHGRKWEGNRAQIMNTFYHRFWNHECSRNGQPSEPFTLVPDEGVLT